MNIFVLDTNPKLAAQYNCDVHCNKIVLEISQMLANCFSADQLLYAPPTKAGTIRKHAHYNHPVSKWLRQSLGNMSWAIDHAFHLEEERQFRGYAPHFSHTFNHWVSKNLDKCEVPAGELTPFAVAIADTNACTKLPTFHRMSTVEKYRAYYKLDKPFVRWTRRAIPNWFLK